jgi:3-hydroxyisobutyrate dehydrogenase-like beta-hydroxyacid dehydrogenase
MTSDESREVSQWANKSGVKYLEGQIINYPGDIRGGRGIIACAGPKGIFDSCQLVIEGMAGFAPHISETLGAAAVLDKALFEIAYPAFVGFLHGTRMCQAMGISVETFADIAVTAYFKNRLIENEIASLAHRICSGDYSENVKAALDAYSPSFGKALRESEALGIDTEHLKGVDSILRRACDAGHSRHDFAAVYEIFKPRKG